MLELDVGYQLDADVASVFGVRRLVGALPQKSGAMSGSALPPDVRLWLCPAVRDLLILGFCPAFGLCPDKF